ncbi:MAG: sodium-translocating pyrophosphatase [Planctomycetaceae bacterium]|nr:sodium-translocating pyrophosphatase [Planctomycetaceae bacterium]
MKRATALVVAALLVLPFVGCGGAPVNPEAPPTGFANMFYIFWWLVGVGGAVLALFQAWQFFQWMEAQPAGTQKMIDIAGYVRTGADAYLKQQYKVVGWAFLAICVLLLWMALGLGVQSLWVPFAFLSGGLFSGLAGWFGMKTATLASNRTAAGAERSLNEGLQIAFRSGAVMGLTVVGLGLLDIMLWFFILYWLVPMLGFQPLSLEEITVTMLCFGMGASTQALFARVGGGIFTKAADVGADLVGKVEHSIPEDDPRNPATIADNVGDNVGDVAGMGADLYESYCGSILATAALGVAAFTGDGAMQLNAVFLPMAIAAVGTILSVWGIYQVRTQEDSSQKALLAALAKGINFSTIAIVAATFGITFLLMRGFSHMGIAISVIVGLVAGWLIGKWTEYATSNEYAPTKELADQALTGPATIIIGGVAEGMLSTWAPVLITGAATLLAFGFANGFNFTDPNAFALGLYGVGIAAVGMLSTLGITLATDAYGPIADNAGGNAQMAGLPEIVRERTDALDALGNTTAATGKGFAIGSAALTALALLAAYVEEVRIGFDRWGHAAVVTRDNVQEVAAGGRKLAAGDWVKLADRLVVGVGDKAENNHVYMVLDPAVLDGRKGRDGKEILAPAVAGLQGAVRGAVAAAAPAPELIAELVNENRVVDVKKATMRDYMRFYDVTLMNPKVLVGMFIGAMSVFVFCALTMKAVGRAAKGMVEEVRRQFREKPGIMEGTELPDYAAPVAISTKAAQKEMVLPSVLALAVPVVVGLLLGVSGVLGLLVGGLTTGFCVAVFMANSGGAWDNAKKYIESGVHGGKGSDAHKAAVVGDTVGDPFKDTSGPSLNILVKLMSMVSVVVAGLVVRYSLEALGIF